MLQLATPADSSPCRTRTTLRNVRCPHLQHALRRLEGQWRTAAETAAACTDCCTRLPAIARHVCIAWPGAPQANSAGQDQQNQQAVIVLACYSC